MASTLRLIVGVTLALVASLTLLPAPTGDAWRIAFVATEFGYWLSWVAVLMLLPGWRSWPARIGIFLSFAATLLFVSSVVRAAEYGRDLPVRVERSFGEARPSAVFAAAARPAPLVVRDLFLGVRGIPVRYEERVYASPDGEALRMDLYHPAYPHGPIPGVVIIHGGSWQSGDNGSHLALNAYLAARDYVVAAITYRLAPRSRFPASRSDVDAAVAFLKAHAPEIGLDPQRLALLGREAGGQLALLVAYTAHDPAIRGVVSYYAPVDLKLAYDNPGTSMHNDARSVLEAYLGGTPSSAPAAYAAASPLTFVSPNAPPTLIIHGMLDPVVSPAHGELLDAKLTEAGVPHLFLRLPWATHGCDSNFPGPCGQITTYAVEHFLGAVLRGREGEKRFEAPPLTLRVRNGK